MQLLFFSFPPVQAGSTSAHGWRVSLRASPMLNPIYWLIARLSSCFRPRRDAPVAVRRARFEWSTAPGLVIGWTTENAFDDSLAGVDVRRYHPSSRLPGVLLFIHGGGWELGSVDSHAVVAATLAALTRREVVSVSYRRAPESPFPAALDDCAAVLTALLSDASVGRIVVCGDSAGGNLAAVSVNRVIARLPRQARGRIAAQVLVYPVTDLSNTMTRSYAAYSTGYFLDADEMRGFIAKYVPDATDRLNPEASPLLAPSRVLSAAPPTFVLLAECDVLHDEGAAYAEALRRAGCDVTLQVQRGVLHGFFSLQGLSEGRSAAQRIAQWLEGRW
jgi:acetyl esterase